VHDARHFRETITPRLGPEKTFLVASFDFGGGSIDSALLRFRSLSDVLPQFQSAHLSLGGDETFGGDNVTTAVGLLVLQRLRTLLQDRADGPPLSFPIAEGDEGPAEGTDRWSNGQHLRALAEVLKRLLCSPGWPTADARAAGAHEGDRLRTAVAEFCGRARLRAGDGSRAPAGATLVEPLDEALRTITLEQVYGLRIVLDADQDLSYSVAERVRKAVLQLKEFSAKARQDPQNAGPFFVVLAGAACRLPLVRDLIREELGDAVVIGDPRSEERARPKSKVASGLALYLDFPPGRVERLSRAGHYTHGAIIWKAGGGVFVTWVPSCFPLRSGHRHTLPGIGLRLCLLAGRKVEVYHEAFRPELIGTFDLSRPASEGGDDLLKELPDLIQDQDSEMRLLVNGSEDHLLLRVGYGRLDGDRWCEYGDWPLIPAEEEPGAAT
jgi:hypothetical protein